MNLATKIVVGDKVQIMRGVDIRHGAARRRCYPQQRDTIVTVRKVEMTNKGNFRISWHSDGTRSTIISKKKLAALVM